MPRFSLRTLLIVAAVVPLAFYALVKVDSIAVSLALTVAVLGWMASLIVWAAGEGESREVARGFAIAALAYGFLALGNFGETVFGRYGLFTTRLLHLLHEVVAEKTANPNSGIIERPPLETFTDLGEVYWCIAFGLAGGWFAAWLYRRRQKANRASPEESTGT